MWKCACKHNSPSFLQLLLENFVWSNLQEPKRNKPTAMLEIFSKNRKLEPQPRAYFFLPKNRLGTKQNAFRNRIGIQSNFTGAQDRDPAKRADIAFSADGGNRADHPLPFIAVGYRAPITRYQHFFSDANPRRLRGAIGVFSGWTRTMNHRRMENDVMC